MMNIMKCFDLVIIIVIMWFSLLDFIHTTSSFVLYIDWTRPAEPCWHTANSNFLFTMMMRLLFQYRSCRLMFFDFCILRICVPIYSYHPKLMFFAIFTFFSFLKKNSFWKTLLLATVSKIEVHSKHNLRTTR